MKTETFEQFVNWLKNNTPPAGHTYHIQTSNRYGFWNEPAEDFANIHVDEAVRRYVDYITVSEYDENDDFVAVVANFSNGGEKPFKLNKYGEVEDDDEDEEDY